MSWIKVTPIPHLPVGLAIQFTHEDLPCEVGIFHTETGIYAIDNVCPHHEASLHMGDVDEPYVYCPMHYWKFNLKTGVCLAGPQFNLKQFQTKVEDGFIWVFSEPIEPEKDPYEV